MTQLSRTTSPSAPVPLPGADPAIRCGERLFDRSAGLSLARSGMSVERIGALIAIYLLPQAWKFLWAPIVDANLTRKRWYVVGATLTRSEY